MRQILPLLALIIVAIIFSAAARTANRMQNEVVSSSAENQEQASPNTFVLRESYPFSIANRDMLASVYVSRKGTGRKEIMSIWSKEPDGYELQYIRTTKSGQSFLKPRVFSVRNSRFMNILTRDSESGSVSNRATLRVSPDSTLQEVHNKRPALFPSGKRARKSG